MGTGTGTVLARNLLKIHGDPSLGGVMAPRIAFVRQRSVAVLRVTARARRRYIGTFWTESGQ
jgi:hypothetical protein